MMPIINTALKATQQPVFEMRGAVEASDSNQSSSTAFGSTVDPGEGLFDSSWMGAGAGEVTRSFKLGSDRAPIWVSPWVALAISWSSQARCSAILARCWRS